MVTYELRRRIKIGIGIMLMVLAPSLNALSKYEYIDIEIEIAIIIEIILFSFGILFIWSAIRNKKYSEEHSEVYKAAAAKDIKYLLWLKKQGIELGGEQGDITLQMLVNDYIADSKYNDVVRLLLINGARLPDIYGTDCHRLFSNLIQSSKQKWFSEEHLQKYINYYVTLLKYHDDQFCERVIKYLKGGDECLNKLLRELIKHDDHLMKIMNRLSSNEEIL